MAASPSPSLQVKVGKNRPANTKRAGAKGVGLLSFHQGSRMRDARRIGTSSLPQRDRDLVDLRSEDEVVLGESSDRVGRELDRHVAVAFEVEVGVVPLLFRKRRNLI